MKNLELRLMVSDAGLTYKRIAKQLGVTPEYLSRCMRFELKPEMRERIMTAIEELRRDVDRS